MPETKTTKRQTVDLPLDMHRDLRLWVIRADSDASAILRTLLGLALNDPVLAGRVERALAISQGV